MAKQQQQQHQQQQQPFYFVKLNIKIKYPEMFYT